MKTVEFFMADPLCFALKAVMALFNAIQGYLFILCFIQSFFHFESYQLFSPFIMVKPHLKSFITCHCLTYYLLKI
jgi:hypothetical protein